MRRNLFGTLALMLLSFALTAQEKIFLFDDFKPAVFLMKHNVRTRADFNFDTRGQGIYFIQDGTVMELTNSQEIDTVYADGRRFVWKNDCLCEYVPKEYGEVYVNWKFRDSFVGKTGAFGTTTQGKVEVMQVPGINSEYSADNFGLDFGDEVSYRRSLFDAVLYNALGCYNEAIHRTHQCGDFLPHCTSFRTLRMLVKENHALGDSLMVVKYCDILDRSLSHRDFVEYFRNNPCPQRTHNTPRESAAAPLIVTKDPMGIMLQMGKADISNPMVMDRYYAYYKVREFFTKK